MAKTRGGEGAAGKKAGKKGAVDVKPAKVPRAPRAAEAAEDDPLAAMESDRGTARDLGLAVGRRRGHTATSAAAAGGDDLAITKATANRATAPEEGVPVAPRRAAAKSVAKSAATSTAAANTVPAAKRGAAPAGGATAKRGAAAAGTAAKSSTVRGGAGAKVPAKSAAGRGTKTARPRAAKAAGSDLREDLRAFAAARPEGWNHDDWLAFVNHLREKGHDVSEPDAIGWALERERLAAVLEAVPGLGPRRIDALVNRFETLWSLRQAHVAEIAKVPGIPRPLAERVAVSLHDRF